MANLPDNINAKLHAVELVSAGTSMQLKAFLDSYVESRTDVKPPTQLVFGHTIRNLIEFFGEKKALQEITEGDADNWCLYLNQQGLSQNTIRRRCGIAKQFFKTAFRLHLIQSNPFANLRSAVQSNEKRQFFVSREIIEQVLESCPDIQWKVIIYRSLQKITA